MDLDAFSRAFGGESEHSAPPTSPPDFEGETTPAPAWIEARAERAAILETEAEMDRDAADRLAAALHPDPTETRPGWHGFTAGALQAAAGEDWPEVATRPEALAALALLLQTQAQRDRGVRPEHYKGMALCETCGPVWIYDREPGRLLACPWCLATKSGIPVPRPNLEHQE
jgi:hypothetical protein